MKQLPFHKPTMEFRWKDIRSFFVVVNVTEFVSMEPTTAETLLKRRNVFFGCEVRLNY
jgi:hypothetical protein